jgi:hypothetical protein
LLVLLAAARLHAQPVAEVRGSVVDARGGEVLSNVVVHLVAFLTLDTMFPILPSAGIVFERLSSVCPAGTLRVRRVPQNG